MLIELNEVDFISAANPLSPTVETFEGFVVGAYDSPFVFSIGTYISSDEINVNPVAIRDASSPLLVGDSQQQLLESRDSVRKASIITRGRERNLNPHTARLFDKKSHGPSFDTV